MISVDFHWFSLVFDEYCKLLRASRRPARPPGPVLAATDDQTQASSVPNDARPNPEARRRPFASNILQATLVALGQIKYKVFVY